MATPRLMRTAESRQTITVMLLPQTTGVTAVTRSEDSRPAKHVMATVAQAEARQREAPQSLRTEAPVMVVTPSPNPAPLAAASAPIQIDTKLIQQSAQDGKSNFRKLAEASGTYTGDAPKTEVEKLGQAVGAATKPDCFDRSGAASLFNIPIMVYMMAKDKCK